MPIPSVPFNITILELTNERVKHLTPITSTGLMTTSGQQLGPLDELDSLKLTWQGDEKLSSDLNDDGLFSTQIFGKVGDKKRDTQFSYVNINLPVFHPAYFNALMKMKSAYLEIIAGRSYAYFDEKINDFVLADTLEGETGFSFFMKYWERLNLKATGSLKRDLSLQFLEKYKSKALTDKILIMPAGLRDVRVGSGGRLEYDEINDIYQKIVGISLILKNAKKDSKDKTYDSVRFSLQKNFNEVYNLLKTMIAGKNKFIQGKWAARKVFNGTRNVISSMDTSKNNLDQKHGYKNTDTVVGLFQLLKGILPISIHHLRSGFLAQALGYEDQSTQAILVNKKTLKKELVNISALTKDRWVTIDGLEKIINYYENIDNRHQPIEIENHYLGLIYKGEIENKKVFKLFSDIDELPEHLDPKDVKPITLVELLYLSGYRDWNKYKAIVTRYPVSGLGSSYPTNIFVRTTVKSEIRYELDEQWNILGEDYVASQFPVKEPLAFFDSTVVSSVRIKGLGADYDGDTVSVIFLYSNESIEEINKILHSRNAYLDPAGGFRTSVNTDLIKWITHNLTKPPSD